MFTDENTLNVPHSGTKMVCDLPQADQTLSGRTSCKTALLRNNSNEDVDRK